MNVISREVSVLRYVIGHNSRGDDDGSSKNHSGCAKLYHFSNRNFSLAPIISGIAAIIMTVFIDPQLSIMTDDVVDGNCTPQEFRNCVIGMVGSKTIGTFLAVFLLVPAAYVIILFARII